MGEPGRGVRTIIDMVAHTRLIACHAGLMHFATAQAINHARHRKTFGKRLIEHDSWPTCLLSWLLEEAALALGFRLAHAYENSANDERGGPGSSRDGGRKILGLQTGPSVAYEAMECLAEMDMSKSPMARLYREAPLNSIWEGSGNVICLDVLRAMVREPGAVEALRSELNSVRGHDAHYDAFVGQVESA